MPLHWTVDSKEKLAIAEGAVTREEVENYITVMNGVGTLYRPMRVFSHTEPARRWIENLPK